VVRHSLVLRKQRAVLAYMARLRVEVPNDMPDADAYPRSLRVRAAHVNLSRDVNERACNLCSDRNTILA